MLINPSPETKLDQLAHESASEDGAGGFMNPKKKRGRPKKEPSQGPAADSPKSHNPDPIMQSQQRIEANKQFLAGSLDFLDQALYPLHETPEARLKPDQKEMIVINGAICMEQYLPDALNKHMPLILVAFGLGGYGFGIYNARKIQMARIEARKNKMNGHAPNVEPVSVSMTQ